MASKIAYGRGALTWKEFKEEAINYAGLVVITFLHPKCRYIQLAHSIVKFLHLTVTMNINNKVIV